MIHISFVIPTWNRPYEVRGLVENIIQQNSIHDDDFEIIVVDDNSSAENWKIYKELLSFRNLKLFRNSTNLGLTKNWNLALRQANGQWICFIHDDDILKEDAVSRIRSYISNLKRPGLIIQNSHISTNVEFTEPGMTAAKRVGLPPASGQVWHRLISEKIGLFDERIKYCPDAEFWQRIAFHYPTIIVREYWIKPIQHDNNYMWQIFKKNDFLEQVELSIRISSNWTIPVDRKDQDIEYMVKDGIWETLRTVLNNTFIKRGEMKNFIPYLIQFIKISSHLNRKIEMTKTILYLPLLRIKDFLRPIKKRLETLFQ